MNVSEDEKVLTDAYYWLSMYKSGATTEVVAMEKVKDAIFEQPQLSENQKIVLDQICTIYSGQIYKSALQAIYIFIKRGMSEEYLKLDTKETNRVLQAFSQWALEQEEE